MPFKVPLWRELASRSELELTVIYASMAGMLPGAVGYADATAWDGDLFSGYEHRFVKRAARNSPGGLRITELRDLDIVPMLIRGRYDLLWLEGYSSITHLLAFGTSELRGICTMLRDDQTLLHPRSVRNAITKEVVLRRIFRRLDAGLYASRENRGWLEHFGMSDDKLFPVLHAVENERFQKDAKRLRECRELIRKRFGLRPDCGPVIVSVSRMAPNKQPAFVIDAFARVRGLVRCSLVLVGSGPLDAELRAKVSRDGIPDVYFAGFLNQSEISQAYACADIFALLSLRHETFGAVVCEAMNFGLPVVVSDKVGCAADVVGDGDNGFVVSHYDVSEAAEALRLLVVDEPRRRRMGQTSRQRISARTIARSADAAVRAAQTVVGRAGIAERR